MKQILLNQTNLITRMLAIFGLGICAYGASAQMSGTYTINSGSAASSTNFMDWQSFWKSLQGVSRTDGGPGFSGGVSSAVTVNVVTSNTDSVSLQFPAISGMSSTNSVTINGGGQTFTYTGTYEAVSFSGGDYFRIKNLKISHANSATNSAGIRFYNASDNNLIDGCTIQFTSMVNGSTSGSAYVYWGYSQGSLTSATSSSTGSYDTVRNCVMQTTGSNPAGPAIAIACNGNTSNYSSTPQNNTISGNTIKNFYYMGIFNYYTNGNQYLNNDISRANATSSSSNYSSPYTTYSYQSYSTNRSTKFEGNNFHDLPYAGASASTSPMNYFYNYMVYNYGNSTNFFSFSNNTYKNIMCYYYCYGVYGYYNNQGNFTGNTFDNIQTYASGYNSYIFYMNYGTDNNVSKNTIQNCSFGYYAYPIYMYYMYTSVQSHNLVEDNIIQNNTAGYYFYAIQCQYYFSVKINRNRIVKNSCGTNNGGFYGIYAVYMNNWQVNSNLIADNYGYYGVYNIYSYSYNSGYTFECRQNTIKATGSNYSYCYVYGLLCQEYYMSDYRMAGNIVDIQNAYYAYPAYAYNQQSSNIKELDNNTFYIKNMSGGQYWYNPAGSANDFNGWIATGLPGPGENNVNPDWMNPSTADYRSKCFETQNNANTTASNPKDATGATRNAIKSDRGAVENYMDIKAESTNFSVPSSVCQGYSASGGTKFTIRNLFPYDTAYNFYVAYSVNGGAKIRTKVSKKTLTTDTATVTFTTPLVLNTVGTNVIRFFIDIPDDNAANDTLKFTTTVKPAPGGEKLTYSTKPTKALYQYGKPFDVTIVGQPVIYTYNSPKTAYTNYTNGDFGTKWTATAYATSGTGRAFSGSEATTTFTAPSGGNDMQVQFKPTDLNLEDTMAWVCLKVSDLTNGCDTTICRQVRINPVVVPDFKYPAKICDGDAVLFENSSTVKSGSMEFTWNFGTGKVADTSNAPEPVFVFPGPGTYKVQMWARTLPYRFQTYDSAMITVGPIPTVKFTKVNACEGNAVKFTNQTVPSNSTYTWDFGDATPTSAVTSPSHTYTVTGAYTVTLKASLNGCAAQTTQKAYEFDKPKASWSLSAGSCDNEAFSFKNTSTIKAGLVGAFWNFNDGNVSTEDNPMHMFSSFGNKTIKLIATSEFGCKDSVSKTIVVKESPKISFTNTPACSLTPTTFTDLTLPVGGTSANYSWDFGDGNTSTAQSPTHAWSSLGPKTVKFSIMLDNGCSANTSKDLNVGVQPKASFTATDVCSGKPMVFENSTTWSQGDITYFWRFGDGSSSSNSDPQHTYVDVTKTTTYFVTLYANIAGGCGDSITIPVTVNESPKTCDFKYDVDYGFGYHGMKFTPLDASNGTPGAQGGVTYTWVIKGVGSSTSSVGQFDVQTDGEYEVTMRARVDATGCECTITKKVVMDRTEVKSLAEVGVAMYPNPSSGMFNLALSETFGKNVKVELVTLTGATLKTIESTNTGLLSIQAGDLSDGVYLVRVSSGDRVVVKQLTIRK